MTDYLRSGATITDVQFVRGILALREPRSTGGFSWVMVSELADLFQIHPNRIRSKMRRTIKRGLIKGCDCGCRGDIELTPKGEELAIMAPAEEPVALNLPMSVQVTIGSRTYSAQTVGDPHDTDTALDLARSVVKALLGYGGEQPEGLQLVLVSGPDVGELFR